MLKSKDIALGSFCCALSVLLLFMCSVIPTGKLALGFLASCMPCFLYIETSPKTSLVSSAASALIAIFIIPKNGLSGAIIIIYSIFLWYWPYLKSKIEHINKFYIEWIIKLLIFVCLSLIISVFPMYVNVKKYMILAAIAALIFYDVLLTYTIGLYLKYISPKIKKV